MDESTFHTFSLVVLRRPRDAPAMSDEELDRLQEQHLARRLMVDVLTWWVRTGELRPRDPPG